MKLKCRNVKILIAKILLLTILFGCIGVVPQEASYANNNKISLATDSDAKGSSGQGALGATNRQSGDYGSDLASDSNEIENDLVSTLMLIPDEESFRINYYIREEGDEPILICYVLPGDHIRETEVPDIPSKYQRFLGWFADGETEAFDFANRTIDSDLDLYAEFASYMTVNIREGQTVYYTQALEPGEVLMDPVIDILPDGNYFATGKYFIEGTNEYYQFGQAVSKDLNLTPEREFRYIIQFDTKFGEIIDDQYPVAGGTITEPTSPDRRGYRFLYWAADGVPYDFDALVSSNLELEAIYDPVMTEYTVMYMIESPNQLPLDFAGSEKADDHNNYTEIYSYKANALTGTDTAGFDETMFYFTNAMTTGNTYNDRTFKEVSDFYKIAWTDQAIKGEGSTIVYVYYTRSIIDLVLKIDKKPGYQIYGVFGDNARVMSGEDTVEYRIQTKYGLDISDQSFRALTGADFNIVFKADADSPPRYGVRGFGNNNQFVENLTSPPFSTLDIALSKNDLEYTFMAHLIDLNGLALVRNIYYMESLDQETDADIFPQVDGEVTERLRIRDYIAYSGTRLSFDEDRYFDFSSMTDYKPTNTNSFLRYVEETAWTGMGDRDPGNNAFYTFAFPKSAEDQVFHQTYKPVFVNGVGEQYFIYLRNSFVLKFENTGHNPIADQLIKYYDRIEKYVPDESQLGLGSNEIFDGWYLEPELINKADFGAEDMVMPSRTVTLYAKYIPDTVTATFRDKQNGKIVATGTVKLGETVKPELIDNSFYERGHFLGWYFIEENELIAYTWDMKINKNMEIFAVWDYNAYHITYETGGRAGTAPSDPNHYIAGVYARVKQGNYLSDREKVFIGWREPAGSTIYYPGDYIRIVADTTLIAVYEDVGKAVTLTYLNDDMTRIESINYLKYEPLRLSPISNFKVSKEGYEFVGWRAEDGTMYVIGKDYIIDRDETVVAVWKAVETGGNEPEPPVPPTRPSGGGGGSDPTPPTTGPRPTNPTSPTNPTEPTVPLPTLPLETRPGGAIVTPPGHIIIQDKDGNTVWEGHSDGAIDTSLPPGEYTLIVINPEGVPLSYFLEIPDGSAPLGTLLPKTGDHQPETVLTVMAMVMAILCGVALIYKRRQDGSPDT